MKKLIATISMICLLVPVISIANQDCVPYLTNDQEGTQTADELQFLCEAEDNEEAASLLEAESTMIDITQFDIGTYACYYIGYQTISNGINCFIGTFMNSYYCNQAIFYGILFSVLCT